MAKEFVIKHGVIINNTKSITGITNDSGLTYNSSRIVTEDGIKNYVDNNIVNSNYWELSATTLQPKNSGYTINIQNNTTSTSPTTGALFVTGGVGIGDGLNVDGVSIFNSSNIDVDFTINGLNKTSYKFNAGEDIHHYYSEIMFGDPNSLSPGFGDIKILTDINGGAGTLEQYSFNSAGGVQGENKFFRADGTYNNPTTLPPYCSMWQTSYNGYITGTGWKKGAQVKVISGGGWTASSSPARYKIYTVPVNSTTLLDRLTLEHTSGAIFNGSYADYDFDIRGTVGIAYHYDANNDDHTFNSPMLITDTTISNNTTTGSIVTSGGVGIGDGLNVGGLSIFNANNDVIDLIIHGYNSDSLFRAEVNGSGAFGDTRIIIDAESANASLRFLCSSSTYQEITWSEYPTYDKIGIYGNPYNEFGGIYSYSVDADLLTWNASLTGTSILINNNNKDVDFIINKSGSSNALVYDSGLDTLNINSAIIFSGNTLRLTEPRTITNPIDSGTIGEISWDNNYLYICVSNNTWKRSSLATW